MEQPAIACSMSALSDTQRRRRQVLWQKLHAGVREIGERSDGFAFRFEASAALLVAVAEFVCLERLCCPFLQFQIEIEAEAGPVRLHISGREGVKAFLQSELAIGK